jgi:hypothetical protein
MPAKSFPHLKLFCWLFMGPLLVLTQSKETVFLIKFGGFFYNKSKILTILFIIKYEKITHFFSVVGTHNQQVFCMFKL